MSNNAATVRAWLASPAPARNLDRVSQQCGAIGPSGVPCSKPRHGRDVDHNN